MTLVIGIKCKDGIVIGSDGAATLGSFNGPTARQSTPKIEIIDNKVLFALSGPVGLSQSLSATLERRWKTQDSSHPLLPKLPKDLVKDEISSLFRVVLSKEFAMTQSVPDYIKNKAVNDTLSTCLVAAPINGEPWLCQFNYMGSGEEATEKLPFVAIGSGQQTADPFLSFLKKVLWGDETLPELKIGTLSVYWALDHGIATSAGGVADPIQITQVTKNSGKWEAIELPKTELDEHKEIVNSLEKSISEKLKAPFPESEAKAIPKPDK